MDGRKGEGIFIATTCQRKRKCNLMSLVLLGRGNIDIRSVYVLCERCYVVSCVDERCHFIYSHHSQPTQSIFAADLMA